MAAWTMPDGHGTKMVSNVDYRDGIGGLAVDSMLQSFDSTCDLLLAPQPRHSWAPSFRSLYLIAVLPIRKAWPQNCLRWWPIRRSI